MRAGLVALICLLAAGCGGGSGVSVEEWAARADAICTEARDRLDAVEPPGELAQVPAYVEKTLPIARDELRGLRALEAPEQEQERVQRFLAEIEQGLAAAERLAGAAREDDLAAARQAGREAQTATREAARHARALGAHACAEQSRG